MRRRAQSSTDYMMTIAVLAIAVVAISWPFYEYLKNGMRSWGGRFEKHYVDPSKGPYRGAGAGESTTHRSERHVAADSRRQANLLGLPWGLRASHRYGSCTTGHGG